MKEQQRVIKKPGEFISPGFFGRRKGKGATPKRLMLLESLLPSLQCDLALVRHDPFSCFLSPVTEIHLEIGFGGGEHLLAQAQRCPHVGFMGCEPFLDGMVKVLQELETHPCSNVSLYQGDAGDILQALPEAGLERVYCFYPDPWPKWRHHKRRFLSDNVIERLSVVLKPGGSVRFATDSEDYAAWTLARFLDSPLFAWEATGARDWTLPWENWIATRYEQKAQREGRVSAYLTFRRVEIRGCGGKEG